MSKVALQLLFVLGITAVVLSFVGKVAAQNINGASLGVANYVPMSSKNIPDGSIVSFSGKGYFLSKTEYDSLIIGVVSLNPAIGINVQDEGDTVPIISTGTVLVRVSTVNGAIHKGDPITSSKTAGVGMKSTRSGYILGTAQLDYTVSNPKDVGEIPVVLDMHYDFINRQLSSSIFEIFNLTEVASYESPITVFKYVVAALVLILSIIFGFLSFGRMAALGVEALGRNPLAAKMIQIGILFNVLITVGIIVAGFAVSYLVLRL